MPRTWLRTAGGSPHLLMVAMPTMAGMAVPSAMESEADANQLNRYLLKKVDELELSVRSANCLKNDNIKRRKIRCGSGSCAAALCCRDFRVAEALFRLEIARIGDLVQKTEAE